MLLQYFLNNNLCLCTEFSQIMNMINSLMMEQFVFGAQTLTKLQKPVVFPYQSRLIILVISNKLQSMSNQIKKLQLMRKKMERPKLLLLLIRDQIKVEMLWQKIKKMKRKQSMRNKIWTIKVKFNQIQLENQSQTIKSIKIQKWSMKNLLLNKQIKTIKIYACSEPYRQEIWVQKNTLI